MPRTHDTSAPRATKAALLLLAFVVLVPAASAAMTDAPAEGNRLIRGVFLSKVLMPAPPIALNVTPGIGENHLGWDAPPAGPGPILYYRVYAADDPLGPFVPIGTKLATEETTFTETGLGNGTTRHYHVRATNALGESPPSNPASGTTLETPARVVSFTAIGGPEPDTIRLHWQPPLDDGGSPIEGYLLTRSENETGPYAVLAELPPETLLHTDLDLQAGKTLHYRLHATNALGAGDSSKDSATTPAPRGGTAGDIDRVGQIDVPCLRDACGEADPEEDSEIDEQTAPGHTPQTTITVPIARATAATPSELSPGLVTAATAGAGLGIGLPIVYLYRRIARRNALQHAQRNELYTTICARPGATTAELVRRLGIPYSTARHHLTMLRDLNEIESLGLRRQVHWFPNHKTYGTIAKRVAAAFATPSQAQILSVLRRTGELPAGDIAQRAGLAANTASHHFAKLVRLTLLVRRREGRKIHYALAPGVEEALTHLERVSGAYEDSTWAAASSTDAHTPSRDTTPSLTP